MKIVTLIVLVTLIVTLTFGYTILENLFKRWTTCLAETPGNKPQMCNPSDIANSILLGFIIIIVFAAVDWAALYIFSSSRKSSFA